MADELRTVLGFDASQAISTLVKLDAQLTSYTSTMAAAANSTTGFNTAAKSVDATLGQLSNAERGVVSTQNDLLVSSKKVIKSTRDTGSAISDAAKKTKKATKTMMLSWQSMARIFAIQTIHQAISKITSALADSVREAMALEIALAEIQTIAPILRNDFEGLADSVHRVSDEFGIQRGIVAEGVYETLSNQIAEGTKAFEFFSAAADLSIGAVMSADSAVNLLSSVINSYGFAAEQAATLSGKLFRTIDLGRVRGEEFANTYGRILVLASQLGVSFDEVNASVATLTISGLKYNEAATLTTNTMLKLIRPTDALKDLMADMGVASAEAGIQAFGFQGFLQKLRDEAGDTSEALGLVFGRVRAIRGVMGLTGAATERYQKTLEELKKAGAEDILEAKELIFKTNAKQVEIELNALKNVIVFDFGREALDVINKIFKAFGGAVNIVKGLTVAVGILTVGAVALAAVFFPWVAVFAAVAAGIGIVTAAYNKMYAAANTKLKQHIKEQEKATAQLKKDASDLTELQIQELNKSYSAFQKYVIKRRKGMEDITETAIAKEEFLTGILRQQLDERISAWDTFINAIEDKIANSADTIGDSQKKIFDIQREIAGFDFEISIKGADALKKSAAANKRSSTLIRDAGRAFREGKTDVAAEYLGEAKAMASMAMASAEAADNAGAEHQARKQMSAVFNAQLRQQKQIQKQAQTQAREATTLFGQEKSRADRIGAIIEKLQDIQIFGPKGMQIGTAEEAKAAAAPWLKSLAAEFEQAKLGKNLVDRLGLQKEFLAATGSFENLFTREPVSLKFTVDQYIDEVFRDIEDYSVKNPIPLKVKIAAEDLGVDVETFKGLEEAPQFLVEQEKELVALKRQLLDVTFAQSGYKEAVDAGNASMINFVNAFAQAEQVLGKRLAGKERAAAWGAWSGVDEAINNLGNLQESFDKIFPVIKRAHAAAFTGDFNLEDYEITLTQLQLYSDELDAMGQEDVSAPIKTLIEQLKKAAASAAEVDLSGAMKADIGAAEEKVKALQNAIGQDLSNQAAVGASGVETAATREVAAAGRVEEAWNKAGLAMAAVGGSTPILSHFGSLIYRASGGDARGTDTVPAMLSPGEFVVNAASTKRFYSQLVAMNAGKSPVYRERGGPVTNVGDVNITVSGATAPKQTARETMKAFRREMRRHTSTF
ncbi:MAG: phage tail tape measure protein [Nitrosomonadaceae bacterium]